MNKIIILLLGFMLSVNLNAQNWEYSYFIDEFGDKTNESLIKYRDLKGAFSNSATSSSDLTVFLIITKEYIDFRLYEYSEGSSIGKQIGNCTYKLFMKIEKTKELFGGIKSYDLTPTKQTLTIFKVKGNTDFGDYESFINLLKKSNNIIKCYIIIENNEYGALDSKYNFKINPIGFTKTYGML